MNMRNGSKAVLCAAYVVGILSAGCAPAVELASKGKPVAVIVHNGHTELASQIPNNNARKRGYIKPAAVALQDYLEKITGAKLPMVEAVADAGDKPAIVLQLVDRVPGASDRWATARQAYRITTKDNRVYLTAAEELGLHHAVFGFLEDHLGCHFYSIRTSRHGHGVSLYEGPGFETVPKQPSLSVSGIDDLQEPAIPNRGLIFKMGQYPWILKNRGVSPRGGPTSSAMGAGHTMYSWIPPKDNKRGDRVIREGVLDEHPEFFPMNKEGEREPDMWNQGVCGTAEGLPKYLAQKILAKMEGKPKNASAMFKIGQGDGFQGCHCPDCRKMVHEQGSEAAPLIHMFNRTLDIVTREYPNVEILTFCYFNSLEAPKNMKVHDNLWVNVVSSARSKNAAGDQMGPIQDNPANADYARALKEWPQLAPDRITVWHWDTYRPEWPSMFYVDDNVRYMADCGVYAINPQTCGGPWSQMLNWLYMKLSWDPAQDGDKLVRQYLEDVYSEAAAPYLYEYLQTGRKAYEAALHNPSAVRWSGWTRVTMDKIFSESVRRKMVSLMDKAFAAAEKHATAEQLAELRTARAASLDKVVMEAARRTGDWGIAEYAGDKWYVPGANPHAADIIQRRKQGLGDVQRMSRFVRSRGGPVVEIAGEAMEAAVCPDLAGQVVSAVDKASGKELLDARGGDAGYRDAFGKVHTQLWLPEGGAADLDRSPAQWATLWSDFTNPHADRDRLATETVLSGKKLSAENRMRRTVAVTDRGLRIERTYTGAPDKLERFNTTWRLAMPVPKRARLTVKGGGIKELMDLRYAEPGGIRTVKAGQRPPGYEGLDAMDEKWDAIKAVSDAQ
ncbi:MAG: DUF4838 domain-containing protein, partial [Planctomycetota bacterium]